ncbi:hypothetical protein SM091_004162 [Cronobacter sakazakii]|nr:hypothetical protein [Cronobacter sakazakii]ELY4757456.1 hypothetical protein [Cronobacter sakazakii]ELY4769611.1 hypothetical protein [Cronobacter sakazakii]
MDKSREQFEAYFIQYHLNDNPEMVELFLKRDGEGYKLPCPNDEWRMWQASRAAMEDEWRMWQASRAAVEIDVPDASGYWNGSQGQEVLNHRQLIADMCDSIRSAGLKVKGE